MSRLYFAKAVAAANVRREQYRSLGYDCIPDALPEIVVAAPAIPPRPDVASVRVPCRRRSGKQEEIR